jgi:betaine-aldehyde dehydrogenase
MGPLITAAHRETVERYVALGLEEGGRLLCGGERPVGDGREPGTYFQPTILEGLTNDARICQEESSGRCWRQCRSTTKQRC